jgi:hypothetical protein
MVDETGNTTRRRLIAGLFGSAIGLLVISAYVGKLATPPGNHPYNWLVAAGIATAFGTLALAVVTGSLAWQTRDDVHATRDLADVAKAEREDALKPYVVMQARPALRMANLTPHPSLANPNCVIFVEVRNLGKGPARDVIVGVSWSPLPDVPDQYGALLKVVPQFIPSLMPSETDTVTCPTLVAVQQGTAEAWADTAPVFGEFEVTIFFSDRDGKPQEPFRDRSDKPIKDTAPPAPGT